MCSLIEGKKKGKSRKEKKKEEKNKRKEKREERRKRKKQEKKGFSSLIPPSICFYYFYLGVFVSSVKKDEERSKQEKQKKKEFSFSLIFVSPRITQSPNTDDVVFGTKTVSSGKAQGSGIIPFFYFMHLFIFELFLKPRYCVTHSSNPLCLVSFMVYE